MNGFLSSRPIPFGKINGFFFYVVGRGTSSIGELLESVGRIDIQHCSLD